MTFFLVIDLVLRIFPFFLHIFRMFTMLNVVYDHFLTRKTQFFTLFVLSRTSDNTTSQNIGGRSRPPQILGGTVPPSPPRSPPLRMREYCVHVCMHICICPCMDVCMYTYMYVYMSLYIYVGMHA